MRDVLPTRAFFRAGKVNRFEMPVVPDPALAGVVASSQGHPGSEVSPEQLLEALRGYVREGALVAFSGGLDSAFLLWAAHEAGKGEGTLVALTTVSSSTPTPDLEDAKAFAGSLEVEHLCIASDELDSEDYARNDRDRCYHCKAGLFRIAKDVAEKRGLKWILYAYTASDHHDLRPGHRAAVENGVVAPLSDHGLDKARIRALMRERGLDLAEKPASPCLSSRITTGIRVTRDRLGDVAAMEAILRRGGVNVCRARVCESVGSLFLRIEVDPAEMQKVLDCRAMLEEEGRTRGYRWVTLDLGGYRTGGGVA